jgi:lactose/L-arabinose transport system substrate-binding protein
MKKSISLFVLVLTLIALVACSAQQATEAPAVEEPASEGVEEAPAAEEPAVEEAAPEAEEAASEPVKITIWTWNEAFNGVVLDAAKELYAKDHPNVEIEVVVMGYADVNQKITVNLAAGVSENLPNIITSEDAGVPRYVNAFPGAFVDLSDATDFSKFAASKVMAATYDGKVYGIPYDNGTGVLYYRKDYLEQAGYTQEDLETATWDEYIEIGEAIYEQSGVLTADIAKIDMPNIDLMLQSAGAWYFDENGDIYLKDNPAMIKAIETYVKFANSEAVNSGVTGWDDWVGGINKGTSFSMPMAPWVEGVVKGGEADQSGKWAIAPIPRLDYEGAVNGANQGGSAWMVLDVPGQEIAIDFLVTAFTNVGLYETILADPVAIGTYLPAVESAAYQQADPWFDGQQPNVLYMNQMEITQPIDYTPYTIEAKDAVKAVLPEIFDGKDIVQALTEAEDAFNAAVGR